MALFGVVFALGVGQAAAQTINVRVGDSTPDEGGALVPVTVTVTPDVPTGCSGRDVT